MGRSYFSNAEREEYQRQWQEARDKKLMEISNGRREVAAKIVMALVDRIVSEIIRPGPKPEERECYEMAGELRELVPELEHLAKSIIDINEGVD